MGCAATSCIMAVPRCTAGEPGEPLDLDSAASSSSGGGAGLEPAEWLPPESVVAAQLAALRRGDAAGVWAFASPSNKVRRCCPLLSNQDGLCSPPARAAPLRSLYVASAAGELRCAEECDLWAACMHACMPIPPGGAVAAGFSVVAAFVWFPFG